MKNLKKILFLVIAIVMMASIFGGCAPSDWRDIDDGKSTSQTDDGKSTSQTDDGITESRVLSVQEKIDKDYSVENMAEFVAVESQEDDECVLIFRVGKINAVFLDYISNPVAARNGTTVSVSTGKITEQSVANSVAKTLTTTEGWEKIPFQVTGINVSVEVIKVGVSFGMSWVPEHTVYSGSTSISNETSRTEAFSQAVSFEQSFSYDLSDKTVYEHGKLYAMAMLADVSIYQRFSFHSGDTIAKAIDNLVVYSFDENDTYYDVYRIDNINSPISYNGSLEALLEVPYNAALYHTVSFETNGGDKIAGITRLENVVVSLPIPIKAGYVFDGWFFDGELQTAVPFPFILTKDLTLYAKWKEPEPDLDAIKKEKINKIQISAGWDFSLMLDTEGNIYAWGLNDCYQLGDGTTTSRTIPTKVPTGTVRFKQISAGYKHSLAIDTAGNIWAWGLNDYGQVGNGTKTNQKTPVKVTSGTVFNKISAGAYHNLAIDASGNIWVWGSGADYRLGTNSTAVQTTPKKLSLYTGFIEVAAGRYHSLAIDTNGNLWSWGKNSDGELGNNSTSTVKVPTKISVSIPDTKFTKISAMIQCLAIDSKGNLWVWGAGEDYRIGFSSTADKKVPTIVPQVGTCVDIVAGRYHSLIVDSNGNIWATGSDSYGKLGNGAVGTYKEFVKIPFKDASFIYVAAGEHHSFAIATDGSLWSWGSGANGRTGHGNTANLQEPKRNETATYYIFQNLK